MILDRNVTVNQLCIFTVVALLSSSQTICQTSVAANLFAADGKLDPGVMQILSTVQVGTLYFAIGLLVICTLFPQGMSQPTRLRLASVLAVSFGLLVGAILCELTCRTVNVLRHGLWLRSPIPGQPELITVNGLKFPQPGYYSAPVRNDLSDRSDRIAVYINRFGMKGPETSADKQESRVILCVGGSTTYGWNLPNMQTYPAQLQLMLNDYYGTEEVKVLNVGVPAYAAQHVIAALKRRWYKLQPDVVLYYGGYNDIWRGLAKQYEEQGNDRLRTDRDVPDLSLDLGPRKAGPVRISMTTVSLARPLAHLMDKLRSRIPYHGYSLKPSEVGRHSDPLRQDLLTQYRHDLEQLISIAHSIPSKPVLATFASCWDPRVPETSSSARWARAAHDIPWLTAEPMHAAMEAYRHAAAQVASSSGVPLIRVDRRIPPAADNFFDTIHLSPQGARQLAQNFFDLIKEKQLLSK